MWENAVCTIDKCVFRIRSDLTINHEDNEKFTFNNEFISYFYCEVLIFIFIILDPMSHFPDLSIHQLLEHQGPIWTVRISTNTFLLKHIIT